LLTGASGPTADRQLRSANFSGADIQLGVGIVVTWRSLLDPAAGSDGKGPPVLRDKETERSIFCVIGKGESDPVRLSLRDRANVIFFALDTRLWRISRKQPPTLN
jgi:hypothetical protein